MLDSSALMLRRFCLSNVEECGVVSALGVEQKTDKLSRLSK